MSDVGGFRDDGGEGVGLGRLPPPHLTISGCLRGAPRGGAATLCDDKVVEAVHYFPHNQPASLICSLFCANRRSTRIWGRCGERVLCGRYVNKGVLPVLFSNLSFSPFFLLHRLHESENTKCKKKVTSPILPINHIVSGRKWSTVSSAWYVKGRSLAW